MNFSYKKQLPSHLQFLFLQQPVRDCMLRVYNKSSMNWILDMQTFTYVIEDHINIMEVSLILSFA